MKHFNLLNNFRWFATIILLITLSVGSVWGATYTYRLVIRKSQLTDGGKYLLLVNDRSTAYNCTISNNYHLLTAGSFTSEYTTAYSAVTTTAEPNTIKYVTLIKKSGDTYYILDSGGKYITATAATSGSFSRANSDSYGWTFSGTTGLNAIYENAYSGKYASFRSYNNGSFRSYQAQSHTSASSNGNVFFLATGCSVTYNANGATSGDVPTDAYLYGSGGTVTVKSNSGTLAKTGFTFAGWNTKANGTGADKAASATFTITQDTVLYAKWVAVPSCSADPTIGNASLNGSFF